MSYIQALFKLVAVRAVAQFLLLLSVLVFAERSAGAASARLIKVLPHFMDHQGRVALNPSLYERDAYQVWLRKNPSERSGIRFEVQWKSREASPLTLKLELRGNRAQQGTTNLLSQTVRASGLFSTWSPMILTGEQYKNFGELSAWRATLWDGDKLVAEQRSFLWGN